MTSTVFTSIPSPRTQATSEDFKQFGITNEIAAPIREVHIYPVSRPTSFAFTMLPQILVALLQASFLKITQPLNGLLFKSILNTNNSVPQIVQTPDIVVSFGRDDLKEDTQAFMAGLGFRKESTQQRHYYRGQPNPEAVLAIAKRGGAMDTYAPYGATNIHGYSALRNLHRIFVGLCAVWPAPLSTDEEKFEGVDLDSDDWTVAPAHISSKGKFLIKDLHDIAFDESGLSFPYFDGLCLVDKTTVPQIIQQYFLPVLANSQQNSVEAFKILRNGWNSLSTTPAGLVITHLAFCIGLAISTGAKPFIIRTGRVYGGVVLVGKGLEILKGNFLYKAVLPKTLKAELLGMNSHEDGLSKLVALLNPKLFGTKEEDKTNYLESYAITSPRLIHNLLRHLKFDMEEQKLLRAAITKLKFAPKTLDMTSNEDVILAIRHIMEEEPFADHIPMELKTESLLTKDNILSVLAAFGASAPTLIGRGTSFSIPIVGKRTMRPDMPGGLRLDGFPIFFKPLQEAYDDWHQIKSSSAITFKTRTHHNQPPTIMSLGKIIPFDDGGNRINDLIATWSSKSQEKAEKKRGRALDDDGGDDAKKRASKKTKSLKDVTSQFAFMGFMGEEPTDSMEIDS